ncbi:MAG TPA: hypothetical protein VGL13_13175 [Polyangiaceae bacterium]|jgi:hypothetical protein
MSAKHIFLSTLAVSLVSLACTQSATEARAVDQAPICYVSSDGKLVRSTLLLGADSNGGERVIGVTELRAPAYGATSSGSRVALHADAAGIVRAVERAKIDASGKLVRLEATVGPGTGEPDARVVLDPSSGKVQITTRFAHIEWRVPNDLPWVWAPILTQPSTGAPVATPADGHVAARAAANGRAVRFIDLGALTSHAMPADQLVVAGTDRDTVIIADDTIDVEDGVPTSLHSAALGTDLVPTDAGQALTMATNVGCAPLDRTP